jgi:hypothetical protein
LASRLLYHDRTIALTDEAMVIRGFTRILGRPRRVALADIVSFRLRERSNFPDGRLPPWGLDDEGVWYTRDRRRFRRAAAIELVLGDRVRVGFSPAHAGRVRDLLLQRGVTED